MSPEDVPGELLADAADAHERWHLAHRLDEDVEVYRSSHEQWAGATLAAVLPAHERLVRARVMAELLGGAREEIAAREAESRTADDTVRLCELARPREHERRVREQVAAEIEDARGPRPRGSALPDFTGAAYDHAARIARGESR